MRKKTCALFLALAIMASFILPVSAADAVQEAVYLGVENYGTVTKDEKPNFQHKFSLNDKVEHFLVASDDAFTLQNKLQEGYIYDITLQDGKVVDLTLKNGDQAGPVTAVSKTSLGVAGKDYPLAENVTVRRITTKAGGAQVENAALADVKMGDTVRVFLNKDGQIDRIYLAFVAKEYSAPVKGVPGQKTLKNFLATAMEPVGQALYVFGGTWDWQDEASSPQSTTIGLAQSWLDFFQSHDASYTYKYSDDPSASYYPHQGWNQYYYAGIDCSAYVAWATYNMMNTVSGGEGYVGSSTKMAQRFADTMKWGTIDYGTPVNDEEGHRTFDHSSFRVGDVFSMNGHVWICLGACSDGSLVILHSTPSDSKVGAPGGGVQISGVGASQNCEAYRLANYYMSKYYPAWSERYNAVCKDYADYTTVRGDVAGRFSWDLTKTLTDPDGYAKMTPAQILADLFGEPDPNVVEQGLPFQDVQQSDWYFKAVDSVYRKNVMSGVSATQFAPGAQMRRAELAQILYNQAGKPAVEPDAALADVPADAWYAGAINWARQQGLMSGTSPDHMAPETLLTRQQMAVILYQYAQKQGIDASQRGDLSSFQDVDQVADWASEAMQWAVGAKLIAGRGSGTLAPNGIVTRAEVAQVIVNLWAISKV